MIPNPLLAGNSCRDGVVFRLGRTSGIGSGLPWDHGFSCETLMFVVVGNDGEGNKEIE